MKAWNQASLSALAALVLGCGSGPEIRNIVLVSLDAVGAKLDPLSRRDRGRLEALGYVRE